MKKKKRIAACVWAIVLTAWCVFPVYGSVYAEEHEDTDVIEIEEIDEYDYHRYGTKKIEIKESGNFKYSQFYNDSVEIRGVTDDTLTSIEIPDEIDGKIVKEIASGAFVNNKCLKEVKLPETIDTIGSYAFANTAIESIYIPDSVNRILSKAFMKCNKLKSVRLSENITDIQSSTFEECSDLNEIKFPSGVNDIFKDAFKGCTSLSEIIIPEGNMCVYCGAFSNCTGVKKVIIRSMNIGYYYILDSFDGVELYLYFGSLAWNDAKRDQIPYNLLEEKYNDFEIENMDDHIKIVRYTGKDKNVEIPSSIHELPVTEIFEGAFKENKYIENITVPDGVKSIGDDAFYECCNLISVSVPETVNSIGNRAFAGCSNLTDINIPDNITEISEKLFSQCSSLSEILIPPSVKTIGISSFEDCISLENVVISDGVQKISEYSFDRCKKIKHISIPKSVTSFGEKSYCEIGVFSGCCSLESIDVDEDNKYFCSENGILYDNFKTQLIRYTPGNKSEVPEISKKTREIYTNAFEGCEYITSVNIPAGIQTISYNAFDNCKNLKEVKLLGDNTEIGCYAFNQCINLEKVDIGNNSCGIDGYSFTDCQSLKEICISPDNESYIFEGGSLFNKDKTWLIMYMQGLDNKSYTIPDGVEIIGGHAFSYNNHLENIIIPEGTKIISNAFNSCSLLKKIEIPDSVSEISGAAFDGCEKLTYIKFGKNVSSIDMYDLDNYNNEIKDIIIMNPECVFCPFPSSKIVIHSYKGSEVEKFCETKEIKFIPLDFDDSKKVKGDINCDGNVDATDLTELSLFLLGDVKLDENQELNADVTDNWKIDLRDLATMKQYIMHDENVEW